jgi:hypothetical protein
LKGERVPTNGKQEEQVLQLVSMIEGQYDRTLYPQVYESLLAIHCAQDHAMRLPLHPFHRILWTWSGSHSEKGEHRFPPMVYWQPESSLRADGNPFNYGAFAQMMDDQEDVAGDLRDRSLTIFSGRHDLANLNLTMNRLFSYSTQLLKDMDEFATPRSTPLIQLSIKASIYCSSMPAAHKTILFQGLFTFDGALFPGSICLYAAIAKKDQREEPFSFSMVKAFFPAIHLASGGGIPANYLEYVTALIILPAQ